MGSEMCIRDRDNSGGGCGGGGGVYDGDSGGGNDDADGTASQSPKGQGWSNGKLFRGLRTLSRGTPQPLENPSTTSLLIYTIFQCALWMLKYSTLLVQLLENPSATLPLIEVASEIPPGPQG